MRLLTGLAGGRRELRLRIGPFRVLVTEVPGESLSAREWRDILLARRSYPAMWGDSDPDQFMDDPSDGRSRGPYRATHYLAWVREGAAPGKLLTMRKVALDPARLTPAQLADPTEVLPPDMRLWRVRTAPDRYVPLWNALRAYARRQAPNDGFAEFRIASMGRVATFPYGRRQRTPGTRKRTAVAFAAMQLLATHGDPHLLHTWMLCPEFRDRVVGVVDVHGRHTAPDFTYTEDTLGLAPGSVSMDNRLAVVREHKAAFPGYFIDNDDAARVIGGLLDGGMIEIADLEGAVRQVIRREADLGGDHRLRMELGAAIAGADHHGLAGILTRPRLFKYLAPRVLSEQPLAGMAGVEFRDCLLDATGDGPFSATVLPEAWAASARAVLAAAWQDRPDADPAPAPASSTARVHRLRAPRRARPWRMRTRRVA